MIELRHLQCFTVCADTGSFSEAARILYTTQSNVSKMIRQLESETGGQLFERHARGIALTARGQYVYRHAQQMLEQAARLSGFREEEGYEFLRLALTPSSWLSDRFVDFCLAHEAEAWRYRVFSGGPDEVIRLVRDTAADIAFVQVGGAEEASFEYRCRHAGLTFRPLRSVRNILYQGGGAQTAGGERSLRLVQRIGEEMAGAVLSQDGSPVQLCTVVATDSDYILDKLLSSTELCNVSGDYMNGSGPHAARDDLPESLQGESIFGWLVRRGGEELLPEPAKVFEAYIEALPEIRGAAAETD